MSVNLSDTCLVQGGTVLKYGEAHVGILVTYLVIGPIYSIFIYLVVMQLSCSCKFEVEDCSDPG